MQHEFCKGSNTESARRNICAVYPDKVRVRKCQRLFLKFKLGDFGLFGDTRSGRVTLLDDGLLQSADEEDSRQSIKELSQKPKTWLMSNKMHQNEQ